MSERDPLDDYKLVKVLGRGAFGEAGLYEHKQNAGQCVIKKIDVLKTHGRKAAEAEVKHLSTLKCRYVVKYLGGFEYNDYVHIIMEYCDGGDLGDYITATQKTDGAVIPERLIVEWTLQLLDGLEYIHSQNVIHRDLKPDNIFLTRAKNIKIGDFSVARELQPLDWAATQCGTRMYRSPEIVRKEEHDSRTDVWSLGCCVAELILLQLPFNLIATTDNNFIFQLQPLPSDRCDAGLVHLVELMLTEDKLTRPTIKQLQQDKFVADARERVREEPDKIHELRLLLSDINKSRYITANQNWPVGRLYQKVSDELSSPVESLALYSEGNTLREDNDTFIEDYQLQHSSVINVIRKVPGGQCRHLVT